MVKIVRLKIPVPETLIPLRFFKAVVLIHQCESQDELLKVSRVIDRSSEPLDPIDYRELTTMIKNQRNRIERNKRI
jgi:hypothetical protein